jgi:hypothetical protein
MLSASFHSFLHCCFLTSSLHISLPVVQELAYTLHQLEAQEAPGPAFEAVQGLLGQLVAAGVQQLAGHLHAVPAWLIAREGWQLSVTHSGSQPITMMPEQLQVSCLCVNYLQNVCLWDVCVWLVAD